MKQVSLALLLLFLFIACKKKDEDNGPQDNSQQVKQNIVSNVGKYLILPSYQTFCTASDSLRSKCQTFIAQPNGVKLAEAQSAWKQAKLLWKQCETFNNFGPGEMLYINSAVDYPAISTSKIESNISSPSSADDINVGYIETRPSTTKGLTALEYLLFDHSGDSSVLLTLYTSSPDQENRKKYLVALAQNINSKAQLIYNAWAPDKDNYLDVFTNNTRTDNYGSFSLLVNSFIQQMDLVKTARIGTPLGKTTGLSNATAVEAYYSHYSFDCMRENFKHTLYIMQGSGYGNMDSTGIYQLMKNNAQHLATYNTIVGNIQTDIQYTQNIPVSFEQAILQQNVDADSLYTSSQNLIRLLKLDLSTAVGVTLTFSDADGD